VDLSYRQDTGFVKVKPVVGVVRKVILWRIPSRLLPATSYQYKGEAGETELNAYKTVRKYFITMDIAQLAIL
jgi:hypothetical protein